MPRVPKFKHVTKPTEAELAARKAHFAEVLAAQKADYEQPLPEETLRAELADAQMYWEMNGSRRLLEFRYLRDAIRLLDEERAK